MSATTLSANHPAIPELGDKPTSAATNPTHHPLFTAVELEPFREDDAAAGRTLGRILCGGFVFTALASGAAGFWTMWHHGTESISAFVVVPAILVVIACIASGWGKAMIEYGAEHDDD